MERLAGSEESTDGPIGRHWWDGGRAGPLANGRRLGLVLCHALGDERSISQSGTLLRGGRYRLWRGLVVPLGE